MTGVWGVAAAYVTWAALFAHIIVTCAQTPSVGLRYHGLGLLCFALSVGTGFFGIRIVPVQKTSPLTLFLILIQTTTALLATALLGLDTLSTLLVVIAAQVAGEQHGLVIIIWVLGVSAVSAMISLAAHPWGEALVHLVLQFGFQLFALSISRALAGERRAQRQLTSTNAELLATRRLLFEMARDQERLRISRELHDVAGHRLTALKLNLESALRLPGPHNRDVSERVTLCRDLSSELLIDIRSVVHELRNSDTLVDLKAALEPICRHVKDTEVHLDVESGLRIRRVAVVEALIRSTQEAITNALKHGHAKNVWVNLRKDKTHIHLSVRDDGRGGGGLTFGHGLRGLSERAEDLGGSLCIETSKGAGWVLKLALPLG